MANKILFGFALFLCAVALAGCGEQQKVVSAASDEGAAHLRQLGGFYRSFAGASQGKAPANEKKFREFLTRQAGGGASVDDLLKSPRDGQPYVVAYNIKLPNLGSSPIIAIHERNGVDGVRLYLTTNLTVEKATEEEFASLDVPKS